MDNVIYSQHGQNHWHIRRMELMDWIEQRKPRIEAKLITEFQGVQVDTPLHEALVIINEFGIKTQHSCAGVSRLDHSIDHSYYAYVTMEVSALSTLFVQFIVNKLKQRVLVIHETGRNRYDLSSFYIQHNRSFCYLLTVYSNQFSKQVICK